MVYFLIYLHDVLDLLIKTLGVIVTLLFFLSGCFLMWLYMQNPTAEYDKRWRHRTMKKVIKTFISTFVVLMIMLSLPSKESIRLMAAAYIGEKIIADKDFKQTNKKSYELLENFINKPTK